MGRMGGYKTPSMSAATALRFGHRHLLGIEGLSPQEIGALLDLSETYVAFNRSPEKKRDLLAGRTIINLFFENSTRTRTSFELAGKRLGGDVINMQAATSSIKKGETLIDTAMTLNAMHPDVLVVRHPDSGAVNLLSQKVDCAVVNCTCAFKTSSCVPAPASRRAFAKRTASSACSTFFSVAWISSRFCDKLEAACWISNSTCRTSSS